MPQHHDMGGQPAGAIDRHEHAITAFDRHVDALYMSLSRAEQRVFTVDELRRTIEAMPAQDYDRLTYYQKWLAAIRALLVEKGVLTEAEIAARIARLKAEEGG